MGAKELEVVCPSGMRGVIRPLKVTEERLYRDAQAVQSNKTIQRFISHGWVRLTDAGPYNFTDEKVVWDRLLVGDAMFLLMQVRAATYTNEYPVVFPCQSCNKPIEHTIDVLKDLRVQVLPEEAQEHVRTDRPLVVTYNDRQISFKLLRLGDEAQISRIEKMRKLNRTQASLAARILDVEGVERASNFSIINWLENLYAGEPTELVELFDDFECGVDTLISAVCEACYYQQELELPLVSSFFQKPTNRKERRREREHQTMVKEI